MTQDRSAPMLLVKLRTNMGEEFRVVTDQVLSFKYTDRERRADVAKLTIDNSDLSNFDDPAFRKGSTLIVQWGYPGAMAPAREVVIQSVKGFRTLEIEAVATSVLMNRIVMNRTFTGRTVSQVVRDIATASGYGPESQIIDDTTEVFDTIAQSRMTDAQFVRRWASRLGFEFYVDFDGFHFHERRLGARPVRTFRYHTDPGAGDIIGEPSIENDITARPGRVRVRGRDPVERADIDVTADRSTDPDRETLTEIMDLIDPEDGNTRTIEIALASEDTVPTSDASAASATARARARFRRVQQVAVKMRLPIIGDPQLLAKTVVQIEGMGQRLSVRYYVEEVEHDLSPSGYVCNLRLVSDGHGGHSTDSRRAVGLQVFDVAGPGSSARADPGALQQIDAAIAEAERIGDGEVAGRLRSLRSTYARGGSRGRAAAARGLATIARDSISTVGPLAAAAQASLAQQGSETAAGGRPNRLDGPEVTAGPEGEAAELEAVDYADPETGASRTRYEPTRGRSTASRDE